MRHTFVNEHGEKTSIFCVPFEITATHIIRATAVLLAGGEPEKVTREKVEDQVREMLTEDALTTLNSRDFWNEENWIFTLSVPKLAMEAGRLAGQLFPEYVEPSETGPTDHAVAA